MSLKSNTTYNLAIYFKLGLNNKQIEYKWHLKKTLFLFIACTLFITFFTDPSWAVTVERLQEPIRHLKTELFSGWMMVVKIGAAATGVVFSAFRGSLAPFGIGAGISLGTHSVRRNMK